MATKALVETPVTPRLNLPESVLVSWLALANGDQGAPVEMPEYSDRTVQIAKTGDAFGGGTMVLEGSNDGVRYFTLKFAVSGTAISSTAIGTNSDGQVMENPRFMRPSLAGGAAGGVDVFLMCHRGRGRAL